MQQYGTIAVIGGGCYGRYYVRQLRRARAAGAVSWERLVVVDRDAACAVAGAPHDDLEMVTAEWEAWFDGVLDAAVADPDAVVRDAVVPSPLMPHLVFRALLKRARARWPDRAVERARVHGDLEVPWQRDGDDGTRYVSVATWMCPINCIEPARCPHTRAERDWSMPVTLQRAGPALALDAVAVVPVTHRAYGVGMFDVRDVLDADARIAGAGGRDRARILVATASHCHGAAGLLEVTESAGAQQLPPP